MILTYKYRAYLTDLQLYRAENWFYILCNLYNNALQERKDYYRDTGRTLTYRQQQNKLPELKVTNPELKLIHSQVLQDCLQRVDKAYQKFFNDIRERKNGKRIKIGIPKRKKVHKYKSLTYPQVWMGNQEIIKLRPLSNKWALVKLPKFGEVKIRYHRPIDWINAKTVTLKRENSGKWFICVSVKVKPSYIPEFIHNHQNPAGCDVGIENFITLSDGTQIENPKFLYKSEQRIKIEQKKLSRKQKGSRNFEKQRIRLARAHEKVKNQRNDFLHKLALWLVLNYSMLYFENLNIKGMVRNHKLAKSIHDSSWNRLVQYVTYKSVMLRGILPVLVSANGTTQFCSHCGNKVKKTLAERIHQCPVCGLVMDRDINAALNILRVGQELSEPNACGDTDLCLPLVSKSVSWKQEAPSVREE